MPLVMTWIMRRLAILVSLAVSATAAAEPPGLTPPTVEPTVEQGAPSYRAQLIASDVVTTALLLGAAASTNGDGPPNQPMFALGLVGYGLGAPIIHLAHHHPGRALASLGLRLAAPLVTAGIGSQLRTCFVTPSYDCDVQSAADSHAAIGLLLGAAGAMVIDTAWLGAAEPARPVPSWTPTVGATRSTFSVGLAGTF
jgi:hypothetical protein